MSRLAPMRRRFVNGLGSVLARALNVRGFRAEIEVLHGAELAETAEKIAYVLRVRNVGTRRWSARGPNPVYVSYRWLSETGEPYVRMGLLTALPYLSPGQEAVVHCQVKTPSLVAKFLLEFNLLRKHVGWFEHSGGMPRRTACRTVAKVVTGFDDYVLKWNEVDLDRDYWSIVGTGSKEEFESLGKVKLDCLIELGLTPQSRVLDVGCGTGQLTTPLLLYLDAHGLYYGTDISAKAVAFCEKKYRRSNFFFLQSEMTRVPIEGRRFDAIALFSVLTHIYPEEMCRLLEDLKRLLDDEGWILADVFTSAKVPTHAGERAMVVVNPTYLQENFAASGLRAELLDTRDWSSEVQRATYRFTHGKFDQPADPPTPLA
jgi:SAM-dependent methyltransferase